MKNCLKEITALTKHEHRSRAEGVILVYADTGEWKEWRHRLLQGNCLQSLQSKWL